MMLITMNRELEEDMSIIRLEDSEWLVGGHASEGYPPRRQTKDGHGCCDTGR